MCIHLPNIAPPLTHLATGRFPRLPGRMLAKPPALPPVRRHSLERRTRLPSMAHSTVSGTLKLVNDVGHILNDIDIGVDRDMDRQPREDNKEKM